MYGKILVSVWLVLASTLPTPPGRAIRFRVLADGWEQGTADAREMVIRDADSLHTVWAEIHASAGRPAGDPKVDFTKHVVVFVRLETQSDTDTRVEVTRASRERGRAGQNVRTIITVEETRREAGCSMIVMADRHVTPYALVEVEGTQEVVFRHVVKALPCESYRP